MIFPDKPLNIDPDPASSPLALLLNDETRFLTPLEEHELVAIMADIIKDDNFFDTYDVIDA